MTNPARTYNQSHVARHADGKRRISIYWTWSYPWEVQRDPALMENRFSTITEVRNVLPPSLILPRDAGEETGGGLNPSASLRTGSAQAIERFERLELRSYLVPSNISR